jgi:tellurite resistance protein TehA-like permease
LSTFAPSMAAGILSIAGRAQGLWLLSDVLLALGVLALAATAVFDAQTFAAERARDRANVVLVLFSWVAACGVLGQRLNDSTLFALAAVGFVAALIVLIQAVRESGPASTWNVTGSWLLGVVAIQSLSIACASLQRPLLAACALFLWLAGMAIYGFLIALILRRLMRRVVDVGAGGPDNWIAMGALAISTVAARQVLPLATLAPAIWVAAAAWIPYLCAMEALVVWRRGVQWKYDALRWSTVFPLGMFSLATHDLGLPTLRPVETVFLWVGLTVAILNLVAALGDPDRRSLC